MMARQTGEGPRTIAPADPGAPGPRALLEAHLALMRAISPPGSVHALDIAALRGPAIRFFAMIEGGSEGEEGSTIAVGALKQLDADHAEIKSMHTAEAARGTGAGRAMLRHLLAETRAMNVGRVSLETGRPASFHAAHALYRAHGFAECPPFGDYRVDPFSICMTMRLHD